MKRSPLLYCTVVFCFACACGRDTKLFTLLNPGDTGINFSNVITETDSLNILDVENIYNGGGVGIGDFNNDGLQDIYFSANQVSNKLYLNKGNFKFDDITDLSGTNGQARWCRGVSVVDINNDGLLDIYVCASLSKNSRQRENILYVNTGNDETQVPRFKNLAAEYGLADTSHSTMAAFFDYDNDGDVDMYLLVNEIIPGEFPGAFRPVLRNGEHPGTDKLFRNDWNDRLDHPVFTDVSKQAGITIEGYGHGVNITDINMDGWKDIYVTNDFLSNNLLYINDHDGTFTDEASTYFKHTSENAMGQDIIDVNNDGLDDVIELDMNPEDNYRKKMMMNVLGYQRYQNNDEYGYQYQYVRNTLQINQGPRILENDSIGPPVFSDIAFYAGIAETDWSWTPSVIDFDNDGFRDIIITNGFPKDVTDHDFAAFRQKAYQIASKKMILEQIPKVKISNYAYKNNGDLSFSNITKEWGMYIPSFSNGAAYADLDNDGDLDYVVNNIDDAAFVYRNNSREINKSNYLQVQCSGDSVNKNGLGARIELHYSGMQQVYENTPYRGYLSSVYPIAHFGLGNITTVDSVIIKWPDGSMQVIKNVTANQLLKATVKNADTDFSYANLHFANRTLLTDITGSVNMNYLHRERDFIDFNIQKLLPHKFSEYGPGLAAGDVDGNGSDDIICGGSFFFDTQIFLQQDNGSFIKKTLLGKSDSLPAKNNEDLGVALFDADNDGDLDLYIASGGYEMPRDTRAYQDRFFVNDGKGNFHQDSLCLPQNFTSKSCVRVCDFDKDSDLDLFVGGRVDPSNYPKPVSSFIFRNETKNGIIKFTDVTADVAPSLINIGLVCDAAFTDFDNDGSQDLILAGEWMPVKFLKNNAGHFKDVTSGTGIGNKHGWWNSIAPGDYDNDGDMDYIVGNLGLNSFYRASLQYPVKIYAKDLNNDGSYDAIPAIYLPTSQEDTTRKQYPAQLRDELIKQMIGFRAKYQTYQSFAAATFDHMFTSNELKEALQLEANDFSHSFLRNMGDGKFEKSQLPLAAQYSCINGMITEDLDGDGNLDILIAGNDYSTEVSVGRYDACNGLMLKGDGKGNFSPLNILQSGWFIPGNGRSVVKLKQIGGNELIAVSQNRGPLKVYKRNTATTSLSIQKDDIAAFIKFRDGRIQKRELNFGASFLSQSARFLTIDSSMVSVEIINNNDEKRTADLQKIKQLASSRKN